MSEFDGRDVDVEDFMVDFHQRRQEFQWYFHQR